MALKHSTKTKIWAVLLAASLAIFVAQQVRLQNESYAYTYAIPGHGLTIYTKHYYRASPLIQESIRIHEADHRANGTFCFWHKAQDERHAYTEQMRRGVERLRELRLSGKTGKEYEELKYFLISILPETR